MAAVAEAVVDAPAAVKERLEAFAAEVLAGPMNRPVQVENGGLYLRGLVEEGKRKSLEPLVERLGEEADYQSLQQFLTDSPWIRRRWCGRWPSGSAPRSRSRRGCSTTPAFPSRASARRG